MSNSFENYQKRRLKGSYLSVTLSMTIVLFVIGALGLVVLKSTTISNYFKQQLAMSIFIKDDVPQKNIDQFVKTLSSEDFASRVVFISKDQAAETFTEELGEDFISFLGANPLKNTVDLYLKPDYVRVFAMEDIEKELMKNSFVYELTYDKPLVSLMNKNIKKISFYTLVICGFFTLISVVLINSSLRLSVYSKRFTIKTMQMVGATKSFIRRPFIWQNVKLGIVSSFIACGALSVLIYKINAFFPELLLLQERDVLISVGLGVFVVGILISSLSTFIATTRFLNLQTEELYN